MGKTALITGITGQDGAYLTELLLNKGYSVHGITRWASPKKIDRREKLFLYNGDMTDSSSLQRIIQEVQPDELYNLAAQSSVQGSFESPEYTANINALGTLRLLEAIRILNLTEKTRFCQASCGDLFGLVQEIPQRETTPFYPRSPYAAAKLYAYWLTVNYRETYNMHACNGIFFNHESPLSGENSAGRRITRSAALIKLGRQEALLLGSLDLQKDWGFAGDYAEAMWLTLQQHRPDDYIFATGESHSVREFVELAFQSAGIDLVWHGSGLEETGIERDSGRALVRIDPRLAKAPEVDFLQGDAGKALHKLGWKPKVSFSELVHKMVAADLANAKNESS